MGLRGVRRLLGAVSVAACITGGLAASALPAAAAGATVSVGDVAIVEGNTGHTVAMRFVVTLSDAQTVTTKLGYTTTDDTALAGQDYTARSGTVSIGAGKTSATIVVKDIGDSSPEGLERFYVDLTGVVANPAVTIADGRGEGSIVDDDASTAAALSISDVSLYEGNAGHQAAKFALRLSAPLPTDTLVGYSTSDGSAAAGSDYKARSGTAKIKAGKLSTKIAITVYGDPLPEPDETFNVSLTSAPAPVTRANGTGTILDDDSAVVSGVSIGDASVVEGDGGTQTASFNVALSEPAAVNGVPIAYTTVAQTATAGLDFKTKSGTLTIKAGKTSGTISVVVIGDTLTEGDETFAVELTGTGASGVPIAHGDGIGTIVDDDAPVNPTPPSLATNVTLSLVGPGTDVGYADLAWDAPLSTGGSPVTEYDVSLSTDGGANWYFAATTGTTRSARVYCGVPAVSCVARVATFNTVGWNSDWAVSNSVVTQDRPSLATNVTLSLVGPGTDVGYADLAWDAPLSTGGSPVTEYDVSLSTDGGANWYFAATTGTTRSARVYCGVPAVSCVARVATFNAVGWNSDWAVSNSVVTQDRPSLATNVTLSLVGPGTDVGYADLAWDAPLSTGGSPVTEYDVSLSTDGGANWYFAATTGTTRSARVYCGVPAVSCVARVATFNAVGWNSDWAVSNSVVTQSPPSVPRNVGVVAGPGEHPDEITVSWDPPADDGGSPVTDYYVDYSTDGGTSWIYGGSVGGNVHSLRLFCGAAYTACTAEVYASNAVGWVGWSAPSNIATTYDLPTTPTLSASVDLGEGPPDTTFGAVLTAHVADDNNRPVDQYEFQWSELFHPDWVTFALGGSASVTSPEMGVACGYGEHYYYRVRVHNEAGWTGWSNTQEIVGILHDPNDPNCP